MKYGLIIGLMLMVACDAKKESKDGSLARVHDQYLSKDELTGLVPAGTSKSDSILMVKSFIDRWAARQLMLKAADVNLGNKRKAELDELVQEYRADLYARAYIEEIVKRSIDTAVSEQQLEAYYKQNKENFRANGVLVRLRYLHLQKDNPKFATIRSKFFDFRKSDRKFWENYTLQMKSSALNDSVWVDMAQVYARLPIITPENRDRMISPGKSIEQPDGDHVYLVKIVNVISPNQIAPYQYLKPTLKDIIINSRKLDMIRKFEQEMTSDAIKENDYEIFK